MRDCASEAPIDVSPAPPRAAHRTPWRERVILRVLGLPTQEEAERILRNRRGLFGRLTPEQWAAMDSIDPYEVLGPANGPKRNL